LFDGIVEHTTGPAVSWTALETAQVTCTAPEAGKPVGANMSIAKAFAPEWFLDNLVFLKDCLSCSI
jgi:hypothetical protein